MQNENNQHRARSEKPSHECRNGEDVRELILHDPNNDLAKLFLALDFPIRSQRVFKVENAIDDRVNIVCRDRTVQVLEPVEALSAL